MHFIPAYWKFDQRGLCWVLDFGCLNWEVLELDPGGLLRAWCPSRLQKPWSWELIAHWWPFPCTAKPLTFLSYYLERIIYCLLGILDFIGIICLFFCFKKSEIYFLEEKWTYLTTTVGTFPCTVSLTENSVWRLSWTPPPFSLFLKGRKLKQCFPSVKERGKVQKRKIYMKSFIILTLCLFFH